MQKKRNGHFSGKEEMNGQSKNIIKNKQNVKNKRKFEIVEENKIKIQQEKKNTK